MNSTEKLANKKEIRTRFICSTKTDALNTERTHKRHQDRYSNAHRSVRQHETTTKTNILHRTHFMRFAILKPNFTIVCLYCKFPVHTKKNQQTNNNKRIKKTHKQKTIKLFCLPFHWAKRGKMVMCVRVLNN